MWGPLLGRRRWRRSRPGGGRHRSFGCRGCDSFTFLQSSLKIFLRIPWVVPQRVRAFLPCAPGTAAATTRLLKILHLLEVVVLLAPLVKISASASASVLLRLRRTAAPRGWWRPALRHSRLLLVASKVHKVLCIPVAIGSNGTAKRRWRSVRHNKSTTTASSSSVSPAALVVSAATAVATTVGGNIDVGRWLPSWLLPLVACGPLGRFLVPPSFPVVVVGASAHCRQLLLLLLLSVLTFGSMFAAPFTAIFFHFLLLGRDRRGRIAQQRGLHLG